MPSAIQVIDTAAWNQITYKLLHAHTRPILWFPDTHNLNINVAIAFQDHNFIAFAFTNVKQFANASPIKKCVAQQLVLSTQFEHAQIDHIPISAKVSKNGERIAVLLERHDTEDENAELSDVIAVYALLSASPQNGIPKFSFLEFCGLDDDDQAQVVSYDFTQALWSASKQLKLVTKWNTGAVKEYNL
jgi:hypothetical protein